MLGELIPCGGGDSIPLLKPELLIGRRSRCDIVLQFPNISSHHCSLELINGYWFVQDLGSRNGIKVNGERCDSKFLLPGDELAIAKHRFEITYKPLSDAPPPEEESPLKMGLMEKAGLVGRRSERNGSRSRSGSKGETSKPARVKPDDSGPTSPDDDLAMQFLNEDGEA
jgi:pSer/pThr/pTyr-binding forkhead associated (FHA) protein